MSEDQANENPFNVAYEEIEHLRTGIGRVEKAYYLALSNSKSLKDELAKLQAEREPRDNGDGTVTAWKPVTYPQGLDVECVRTRRRGDLYATSVGAADESDSDELSGAPGNVWLILRPAPQPPEPVTWEAPALIDGEWQTCERYVEGPEYCFEWGKIRGLTKPAKLGTYRFRDGVGTLIREES